jgi:hypothetical protein
VRLKPGAASPVISIDTQHALAHHHAIDRNWERRLAETPGLFDGPVYLASGCVLADGACEASLFEVRYSRFLAFRDAGGSPGSGVPQGK